MHNEQLSAQSPLSLRDHRQKNPLNFWSSFPNTSAEAAYFELTQHIELYEIDKATLDAAIDSDDVRQKLKVFPTLVHEVRHWLDHVATLWGQRNLASAYNAMHSWQGNDESHFWRILQYKRTTQRDRFSDYFTTVNDRNPPTNGDRRWAWELTCGLGFDTLGKPDEKSPIVFTKFRWQDGRLACRVPFSVASLLESNAMHFDIRMEQSLLASLPEGDRQIETQERVREHLKRLYNPDLAVYSVAAHLLANRLNLSDVLAAYELTSCLASLSLNLPETWFDQLKVPKSFAAWGDRGEALIASRNHGFAFLVLATNAPIRKERESLPSWCDAVLAASGLRSTAELRAEALVEMNNIRTKVLKGSLSPMVENLMAFGRGLFDQFGPTLHLEDVLASFPQLSMPVIVLSDITVTSPSGTLPIGAISGIERWIDEANRFHAKFEEFVAACGV